MKNILASFLTVLALIASHFAQAQIIPPANNIQTLMGNGNHFGFYFGLGAKASTLGSDQILLSGARLGIIANRSLAIGVEGYGLIPYNSYSKLIDGKEAIALGGYGGLTIEPIFFSNSAIHFTLPVHAGAGWLGFQESWLNDNNYNYNSYNLLAQDVFWYVEPGVNVEVNISKILRLNLGASKRFVQDLSLQGVNATDLNNINYNLTLKIGRF